MDALLQKELDELEEEQQEERQGFKIDNLEGANWCFRKLKALKDKAEENKLLAAAEKQRIELWLAAENKKLEADEAFFKSVIMKYFSAEREKDPKFKLSTPYGKISSRKTDDWQYDEAIAITSLKEMGLKDLIRTKEELDKTSLKSAKKEGKLILSEDGNLVTAGGEIIEGIKVGKIESITITSV